MKKLYIIAILPLVLIHAANSMKNICSSTNDNDNPQTNTTTCDCANMSSEDGSGLRIIKIDCRHRRFNLESFEDYGFPYLTDTLDLSNNDFEYVPYIKSERLRVLKMAKNKIRTIDDKNFVKISNLRELDLSWNEIHAISINAFAELFSLQKLDLSHNRLKLLGANVFSPLQDLDELNMSWNPEIHETFSKVDVSLFERIGVTPRLETLKMEHCNLEHLNIIWGGGVRYLHLRSNNFTKIENVPRGMKYLDLSDNPIEELHAKSIPTLFILEELVLQDMPKLWTITEYSFYGLPNLKRLKLTNSNNLSFFSSYAFGINVVLNETDTELEELDLRGTSISYLNSSLVFAFQKIKILDLRGTPLMCDCQLAWLKDLKLDTGGMCNAPIDFEGRTLATVSSLELCKKSIWLNPMFDGFIICLLLVGFSVGIWFIVKGLRTSHTTKFGRTIGSASPYARITIEPNRIDNHY